MPLIDGFSALRQQLQMEVNFIVASQRLEHVPFMLQQQCSMTLQEDAWVTAQQCLSSPPFIIFEQPFLWF